MTITVVDPRGVPATAPDEYTLTAECTEPGFTVGLLANGFPDSVRFLGHVGRALESLVPGLKVRAYDKGDASRVASPEMLATISGECHAVVAAYGH